MSKLISLFMHDEAKQTEKGNLLNSEARTRVRVRLRERESAVQQSECTSESESRESERPPLPLPLPVSSELRAQSSQTSESAADQNHPVSQLTAGRVMVYNKITQSHVGMVLSTCCNKCRADPPTDAYTGPVDFLRPKPRPQYIDPAMVRLVVRGLRALAPIPSSSLPDEPISWLSP